MSLLADAGAETSTWVMVVTSAISTASLAWGAWLTYRTNRDKLEHDDQVRQLRESRDDLADQVARLTENVRECQKDREDLRAERESHRKDVAEMRNLVTALSQNFRVAVHDVKDTANTAILKTEAAAKQAGQP